jgi:hypothetical protein
VTRGGGTSQGNRASSKQIRFAPSTKSNGSLGASVGGARNLKSAAVDKRRDRPILTDEHEETMKFSSASGNSHS